MKPLNKINKALLDALEDLLEQTCNAVELQRLILRAACGIDQALMADDLSNCHSICGKAMRDLIKAGGMEMPESVRAVICDVQLALTDHLF